MFPEMKYALCLLLVALSIVAVPIAHGALRQRATLGTFTGSWIGHTRGLVIRHGGHATESISSGCCDPVINLTFRLSRPGGTTTNATVTATVTGVWIRDRSAYTKAYPAPHVGEMRVLRLRNGVLTETLTGANYCDNEAENAGKCGA
jgi:hypothetical protein